MIKDLKKELEKINKLVDHTEQFNKRQELEEYYYKEFQLQIKSSYEEFKKVNEPAWKKYQEVYVPARDNFYEIKKEINRFSGKNTWRPKDFQDMSLKQMVEKLEEFETDNYNLDIQIDSLKESYKEVEEERDELRNEIEVMLDSIETEQRESKEE